MTILLLLLLLLLLLCSFVSTCGHFSLLSELSDSSIAEARITWTQPFDLVSTSSTALSRVVQVIGPVVVMAVSTSTSVRVRKSGKKVSALIVWPLPSKRN